MGLLSGKLVQAGLVKIIEEEEHDVRATHT